MREGWEIKKLGEVCEFKSGTTIPSNIEKPFGEILYTKVGDMNIEGNEVNINSSSRYVSLSEINQNQIIPIGSIIFPKRGEAIATNKKRRIIKPTIVDLNTMALIPSQIIDKDYLYYWFQQIDLAELSNGTSIPQINNYSFDNVYISYPKSLSEQQRIVSILDEAFAAIDQAKANVQKNLNNAKELFQSELNTIFSQKGEGWMEKKLGEITTKIGSGATPRGGNENYKKTGVSLIRSMNVYDDGFRKKDLAFIDEQQATELKNVTILENDVLLNITGASVARCCIVPKEILPARVNQHVSIIRIKDNIVYYRFLHFALISNENKKQLLGIGEQGSTRQAITKLQIENFKISFPEQFEAQQKIVARLDILHTQTKNLESLYQQKLNELEDLKKSILEKAFKGELTTAQKAVFA